MNNNIFLTEMGKRIAERRKELKMTQEQVAEAANLSLQSISCIELGKKAIRPENLLHLSQILQVSADYLLTGKRSEEQTEKVFQQIAALPPEDFRRICDLADRFSRQ